MKRFYIFLLIVTAILGFISCDIRSELIGPLNYADTLYVYHKDTIYISTVDTLYLDCNCGGNSDTTPDDSGQNPPSEPEKPAVLVDTRTITVDMTGENPFKEDLRGSQKAEYVEYTLTEGGYKFGFYNAFKSSTNIRLTGNTEMGYLKFPAIDGFKLTNITLKSGASTGKYIRVWSEDPLKAAKEFTGFTLQGTEDTTEEQSFDMKDTQVGVAYYISATSKNTQFSKLVLTYGKFE